MPEGHVTHRLARLLTAEFGGRTVRVSSPQGRFADAAALLDRTVLTGAEAAGKHLFVGFEHDRVVWIHLGLIGKLQFGPDEPPVSPATLRLRIAATGLSTYADVAVVCGPTLRAPDDRLAVTNPVLLVEVTNPSTEGYDRGERLRHYQLIPSVREVLFVSHRGPALTLHRREDDDTWLTLTAGPGESLELVALAARVAVDDVYRDALEDAR